MRNKDFPGHCYECGQRLGRSITREDGHEFHTYVCHNRYIRNKARVDFSADENMGDESPSLEETQRRDSTMH